MNKNIVEMRNICKQFHNISVLKNIDLAIQQGEVHSIFGENGAGKSILVKILSGVVMPESGDILFLGNPIEINKPSDAQKHGIRTIFQEQELILDLTVAENIYISKMNSFTNKIKIINRKKMIESCREILRSLDFRINPESFIKDLGLGERQLVDITKALVSDSKVIIMDEPTASLTKPDKNKLYRIIRNLKERGVSVIFISHNIDEVLSISDKITIMKNGEVVITDSVVNITKDMLIQLSADKNVKDRYPKLPLQKGRTIFKMTNVSTEHKIKNISFEVGKCEIVGITGLVGSGKTAIARAIFGLDKLIEGEMHLNGTQLRLKSPRDAIKAGIGYITEDRLIEGLIGNFTIPCNITLANLFEVNKRMFINTRKEIEIGRKFVKKLVIKTPFMEQKVKELSAGNQQKTVISKWLFNSSKLLIFDEPTTGLDTGSKVEVYNILNEIALNKTGIIIISSDFSELIGMCDRILVICNGEISEELKRSEFSLERIIAAACDNR